MGRQASSLRNRLRERGISQGDAWTTFNRPEEKKFAKTKGAWVFYKNYSGYQFEVVANQNKNKEWVVLSVWSKNNLPKTKNYYNYGFLENFVEKILQKLFGKLKKKY